MYDKVSQIRFPLNSILRFTKEKTLEFYCKVISYLKFAAFNRCYFCIKVILAISFEITTYYLSHLFMIRLLQTKYCQRRWRETPC